MTTKKPPPTNQPPQIPEIPAELQQTKLRDLTLEQRLRLTWTFLRAGFTLASIGAVRRKFDVR